MPEPIVKNKAWLESKWWFRLIKVIYIGLWVFGGFIVVVCAIVFHEAAAQTVDLNRSEIVCNNGTSYTFTQLNLPASFVLYGAINDPDAPRVTQICAQTPNNGSGGAPTETSDQRMARLFPNANQTIPQNQPVAGSQGDSGSAQPSLAELNARYGMPTQGAWANPFAPSVGSNYTVSIHYSASFLQWITITGETLLLGLGVYLLLKLIKIIFLYIVIGKTNLRETDSKYK